MPASTLAIADSGQRTGRRAAIRALLAVSAGVLATGLGDGARAAEYCVVCAEPAATYRCVAADVTAGSRDAGARLACIQDIARRAGHQTCAIDRSPAAVCAGREWVLSAAAVAPAAGAGVITPASPEAPAPNVGAGPGPGGDATRASRGDVYYPARDGDAGAAGPAATSPRDNPGELSGQPQSAAGKVPGKAGSAVGNAAGKAWDCVSSLFSKC